MNILKSFFLFTLMSLIPSVALYLIFDELIFRVVIGLFLLLWAMIYFYIDKLLLAALRGREVVDTDYSNIFQCVKNQCYKTKEPLPKIYLYSGNQLKAFVLESRNEWTIVLDRRLVNMLDEAQTKSLVKYLFEFKMSGLALVQTKVMGIFVLIFNIIHLIFTKLFFLNESSRFFKVLLALIFALVGPIIKPLELLGKRKKLIHGDLELKSVVNQLVDEIIDYNKFITYHLISNIDPKKLLLEYLEGYPVLENCRFNEAVL